MCGSVRRGDKDAHLLKFSPARASSAADRASGKGPGSNDRRILAPLANMVGRCGVQRAVRADGYVNHRSSCSTPPPGSYKRHWGAYGNRPNDSYSRRRVRSCRRPSVARCSMRTVSSQVRSVPSPPPESASSTPCGSSHDGLVYVCDRTNDRLQVF